ncbi:hypothetical protein BH10PSE17_BH10PSE17_39200 [soil metagenome]
MARVTVNFGPDGEFEYRTDETPVMSRADANSWIDQAFVEFECEPVRPSGKVLVADKILAVAEAAGPLRFSRQEDWARDYAQAAALMIGRPEIRVDTEQHSVGF